MNERDDLESRLSRLERVCEDLTESVARLEQRLSSPPPRIASAPLEGVGQAPAHAPPSLERIPPPIRGGKTVPHASIEPAGRPELGEAQESPGPKRSLESWIGEQWFLWIGVVAGLVALGTFLKLSFDRGWITPPMRFWAGIGSGLALTGLGFRSERKLPLLAHGLWGGALGCFHLSFFAGARLLTGTEGLPYLSDGTAFYGMGATTILGTFLAAHRNSKVVGGLTALGGYLTPLLVASIKDDQVFLFAYMAILTGGLLAVEVWRGWRLLDVGCFLAVGMLASYVSVNQVGDSTTNMIFVGGFFLLFSALPTLRSLRAATVPDLADPLYGTAAKRAPILLSATGLLSAGLIVLTLKNDLASWRIEGFAVLAMAVVNGAFALIVRKIHGHSVATSVGHAVTLTLLLMVYPLAEPRIAASSVSFAWTIESAALMILATRQKSGALRFGSIALLLLSCGVFLGRVFETLYDGLDPFWNELTPTFITLAGVMGYGYWYRVRFPEEMKSSRTRTFVLEALLALAAVGVLFGFLLAETQSSFDRFVSKVDVEAFQSSQHSVLMMGWGVGALVLVVVAHRFKLNELLVVAALGLGLAVLGTFLSVVEPFYHPVEQLLFNTRFGPGLSVASAVLLVARGLQRNGAVSSIRTSAIPIIGHALVITLLSAEANDFFLGKTGQDLVSSWIDGSRATAFTWSLLWTLYSLGLVIRGIATRNAPLRLAALVFLMITVFKVFLFDLSFLTGMGRVLSFLVLAVILVLVSSLYQKFKDRILGT